jgi:Na+-driven multidrug efflux pump
MGLGSSIVHVLAMIIGLAWGVVGVAIAVSCSRILMKLPMLAIAYQRTEIRLMDFIRVQSLPILASALAGAAAWFMNSLVNVNELYLLLILSMVTFGVVYLIFVLLSSGTRAELVVLKEAFARK